MSKLTDISSIILGWRNDISNIIFNNYNDTYIDTPHNNIIFNTVDMSYNITIEIKDEIIKYRSNGSAYVDMLILPPGEATSYSRPWDWANPPDEEVFWFNLNGKDYSGVVIVDEDNAYPEYWSSYYTGGPRYVTIEIPKQDIIDLSDNNIVGGKTYDLNMYEWETANAWPTMGGYRYQVTRDTNATKLLSFIVDRIKPVIQSIDMVGVVNGGYADQYSSHNITVVMTNEDVSGQTLTLELNGVNYTGIVDVSRVTIEIPRQTFLDLSDDDISGGKRYDISASVSDFAGNAAYVSSIYFKLVSKISFVLF